MCRSVLLLACLSAFLSAVTAAEARPERRIDLAAATALASASAANAPASPVAVECVRARGTLHHRTRSKAICLVWTFERSGEPGDHCLYAINVRFAKPQGSRLKAGKAVRVMCGLAAPRQP